MQASRFMECLEDRILLAADLHAIEAGLKSGYFSSLQDRLNSAVFAAHVPLVGNQLSNPSTPAGQMMQAVNAGWPDSFVSRLRSRAPMATPLSSLTSSWGRLCRRKSTSTPA
jgi:hypothetical protein